MPLTEKQLEFLANCTHRWNIKVGAAGSGKSFADYTVTIPQRILAARGEGLLVLMGDTRGTLERNILEPMRSYWPGLVGNVRSNNTVALFGKKAYALGADNKKHIARIQGATFEYVYGDEITTWDEGVFQMLKSRLRCEHSHFDGTCNPENPNHWFKKFLDSGVDIYQQNYVMEDGRLPPKFVEELKKEYAGTVNYDRLILGLWSAAQGQIYPMFDPQRHVLQTTPQTEGPWYVSGDFGIQNATAFLLWRKEKSSPRWLCLKEYYYSGRESQRQKTTGELVEDLRQMLGGEAPKAVIVDPSAAALKVQLRREGFRVRDARNEVLAGLCDVQLMLSRDQLAFSPACGNTIREFSGYVWDSAASARGQDAPLELDDHCMDAVRYFVRTRRLASRVGRGGE